MKSNKMNPENNAKKTTVLAFGSFDVLHFGHRYFLRRAKSLGDRLVVVVARGSSIKRIKKQAPKYNESERIEHVKKLNIADEVLLGYEGDPYKIVEDVKPDIIALGYDQTANTQGLQEKLLLRQISAKVVRLDAYKPEIYKSSKLKK